MTLLRRLRKGAYRLLPDRLRRKLINRLPSEERIALYGYRAYVGGWDSSSWYGIGKLQYHFLVKQGLRPNHVFLDIACGALRLGQFVIPFLDEGNYRGIDLEKGLIDAGRGREFFHGILDLKKPRFEANGNFDFSFAGRFDYAIAQSLFTHLTPEDIRRCLGNLRRVADSRSVLFFTFREGDSARNVHSVSHANRGWEYSFREIEQMGRETGWTLTYIGEWQHPRGQMMVRGVPAAAPAAG